MIPEVDIPVLCSKYCPTGATPDGEDFCAANLLPPYGFKFLKFDDSQFSFGGSKDEIMLVMIGQVIARGNFRDFLFFFRFDKHIVVL